MIIFGNHYTFTDYEIARLEKKHTQIIYLSRDNKSDDEVIERLRELIDRDHDKEIILNLKAQPSKTLSTFLTHQELKGVDFHTFKSFMESHLHKCFVPNEDITLDHLQSIRHFTTWQYVQKRFVDYTASLILLSIAWPIMVFAMYKIKKDSPGTIFFRQNRVGLNGKEFSCIKFRSMHLKCDFDPYTRDNDPRIFDFGIFMRKTRIDELPQLFNVLKGEMHLVGPRAEWNILVENYEKEIPYYNERHLVHPGITGWAQVHYPYGRNSEDTRQKLMYDFYYIKYWSLWLEIKTIFKTIKIVLGKNGL